MQQSETITALPVRSRPISGLKRALFTLIALVLIALMIEGAFRALLRLKKKTVDTFRRDYYNVLKQGPEAINYSKFYEPGLFMGHPYLPFVQRPNLNHVWVYKFPFSKGPVEIDFKTNRFGLRGPEISLRRQPGTYRILCLGGSTTFGELPEKDCWPRTLERKLREAHPGRSIEVLNAGVLDYTSADSLVSFELRWVELEPNLVIVHHLLNDFNVANLAPFYADYSHARKPLPSEPNWIDHAPRAFEKSAVFCFLRWKLFPERRNNIFNLVHVRSKAGYNPYGLVTFIRNMRNIVILAKARGMQVILTTMHYYPKTLPPGAKGAMTYIYPHLPEWNQALRDLAKEQGAPLVDQFNLLPDDVSLHYDGWHLSPKGEALMAGNFFDDIEREGWIK